MAKGLALIIGLNSLDRQCYGYSGYLNACENDAKAMAAIAEKSRFEVTTLLTRQATRSNIINAITKASGSLTARDIFLISYSGHGGQVPDYNGDEIDDRKDETWCLYDDQLIDDEIYSLLAKFPMHCRILVFSDSCSSGTVTKALNISLTIPEARRNDIGHKLFQALVDKDKVTRSMEESVYASVILISGCQDSQQSDDGMLNSPFTAVLKHVWNEGKFNGNYRQFHHEIENLLPDYQKPNYFFVGKQNDEFENQIPFTI